MQTVTKYKVYRVATAKTVPKWNILGMDLGLITNEQIYMAYRLYVNDRFEVIHEFKTEEEARIYAQYLWPEATEEQEDGIL